MARPLTVDEFMQLPWKPVFTPQADGTVCVTVPPLKDFAIYGPEAEVREEWSTALRGLLKAYIANQKAIPVPGEFAVTKRTTGEFEVAWIIPTREPQVA